IFSRRGTLVAIAAAAAGRARAAPASDDGHAAALLGAGGGLHRNRTRRALARRSARGLSQAARTGAGGLKVLPRTTRTSADFHGIKISFVSVAIRASRRR